MPCFGAARSVRERRQVGIWVQWARRRSPRSSSAVRDSNEGRAASMARSEDCSRENPERESVVSWVAWEREAVNIGIEGELCRMDSDVR